MLVRVGNQPGQLFNIAADVSENTDLAGVEPKVTKRLAAALGGPGTKD